MAVALHNDQRRTPTIIGGLDACESPIERLLASTILAVSYEHVDDGWCSITPQFAVDTDSGSYRIDLVVGAVIRGALVLAAVECDGHDYHERTREQAAHDKRRDRAIGRMGFAVLRFTGSDIHNQPRTCAQDVFANLKAAIPGGRD